MLKMRISSNNTHHRIGLFKSNRMLIFFLFYFAIFFPLILFFLCSFLFFFHQKECILCESIDEQDELVERFANLKPSIGL